MFPEIFRDDVFRLETRRLWLRWPTARDEATIERLAGAKEVATETAHIPHPYPKGAAASFIYGARVGNAQGGALTFALAPVSRPHELIGITSLREEDGAVTLGYWLGQPFWGRGLMSEAVDCFVGTAFQLTNVRRITATAQVGNPASRRVLEKCGFLPDGESTRPTPERGGDLQVAHYARDRLEGAFSTRDLHA